LTSHTLSLRHAPWVDDDDSSASSSLAASCLLGTVGMDGGVFWSKTVRGMSVMHETVSLERPRYFFGAECTIQQDGPIQRCHTFSVTALLLFDITVFGLLTLTFTFLARKAINNGTVLY
jgi:hypothetical protein